MAKRLDQERQQELEPERIQHAVKKIAALGYEVKADSTKCWFTFKGHQIIFFPYSGWASGKTIKDGRGLQNLLKQLQP